VEDAEARGHATVAAVMQVLMPCNSQSYILTHIYMYKYIYTCLLLHKLILCVGISTFFSRSRFLSPSFLSRSLSLPPTSEIFPLQRKLDLARNKGGRWSIQSIENKSRHDRQHHHLVPPMTLLPRRTPDVALLPH
jgi:hypothetical protein